MVLVPGGSFVMGSLDFYPEERPLRRAEAGDLWVDEHPVTNTQFRRFVADTGHVTVAEQPPEPADFPGADPADLVPGSQVFMGTPGPVRLDDWMRWWAWVPGADWRHPEGPGSNLHGRDLHPVVHVGFEDAAAYAGGPGRPCQRKWTGNTPPGVGWTGRPTPGARSSCRAGRSWRTPGTAGSPSRTFGRMALAERRR